MVVRIIQNVNSRKKYKLKVLKKAIVLLAFFVYKVILKF